MGCFISGLRELVSNEKQLPKHDSTKQRRDQPFQPGMFSKYTAETADNAFWHARNLASPTAALDCPMAFERFTSDEAITGRLYALFCLAERHAAVCARDHTHM